VKTHLWIPCHSKGKAPLLSEDTGTIAQAEPRFIPSCWKPQRYQSGHTVAGGKPILRLYYDAVKMAGFECRFVFIPRSACACEEIQLIRLCIFSCVCFGAVCFLFTLFQSLYCKNPGQCPFLFM